MIYGMTTQRDHEPAKSAIDMQHGIEARLSIMVDAMQPGDTLTVKIIAGGKARA